MIQCTVVFMMWLQKFSNYQNFGWGNYGWFMESDNTPLSGWFTFKQDVRSSDRLYLKEQTIFFDVAKDKRKLNNFDEVLQTRKCKLDGKLYFVYERLDKGKK